MTSRNLVYSFLAVAMTLSVTAQSAQAQRGNRPDRQDNRQVGIGNLIAALVNVQTGDIVVLDARNVLRGADIDVLNNALNNLNVQILNDSEILSDIEITDILNDLNVNVEDVVVLVNALGGAVIFLP